MSGPVLNDRSISNPTFARLAFWNDSTKQWEAIESANPLPVAVTAAIAVGDVEIGAVEIKNGTSDQRAVVDANGSVQQTVLDSAGGAILGVTTGAAVITDAAGSIQQYLRGLVKRWVDALGAGTAAAALRTTLASDDPAVATLGATSGAAVIADAAGTIQQYLRGLVKRWVDALGAGTAAAALRTTLASDDPLVAAFGAKTDAKSSSTDATSISGMQVLKQISASCQGATPAGEAQMGFVNKNVVIISAAQFTRPNNTTTYANLNLIANSVTAGSVVALTFANVARVAAGSGQVRGFRIQKSNTAISTFAVRLHLFSVIPTFTSAGDGSPFGTVVQASGKGYLGYLECATNTASAFTFQDVAVGIGGPGNSGTSSAMFASGLPFVAVARDIYGVLQSTGAYVPTANETFNVDLFVEQN